ncbi:hypothetical protein JCM10213_000253 [Rhodosporidiobolus nylandii]
MGISADLFVSQPVPEYFKCPICLEVLQDPVLACSEEHLNCRKCLQSIKDSGKTSCATCRRPFPLEVRPAKLVSRSIEALEVRCRYHKKGCKWKGPVGNRVIHLPQAAIRTENALKKATAPATSVEQAPPPAGPSADNLKSVPLSLSKPKRNVRPSLVLREAQDAAELEKDRKAAAKGKRARSASVTASGSDDGEKEAKVAKKVA